MYVTTAILARRCFEVFDNSLYNSKTENQGLVNTWYCLALCYMLISSLLNKIHNDNDNEFIFIVFHQWMYKYNGKEKLTEGSSHLLNQLRKPGGQTGIYDRKKKKKKKKVFFLYIA